MDSLSNKIIDTLTELEHVMNGCKLSEDILEEIELYFKQIPPELKELEKKLNGQAFALGASLGLIAERIVVMNEILLSAAEIDNDVKDWVNNEILMKSLMK